MALLIASLFLTLFLSPSCNTTNKGLDYSLNDFNVVAIDSSLTHIHHNSFIGKATMIKVAAPGQLILLNRLQDTWLSLINIDAESQINFLRNGKGPMESLAVDDLFVKNDTLFVSGTIDSKVFYFKLKKDKVRPISECVIPDYHLRIAPYPEGGYLCLPLSGGRFVRISKDCLSKDTVGTFPLLVDENRDKVSNLVFQSMLGFSPDGSRVVSVFQSINCFQIFNESFESTSHRGPVLEKITIKTRTAPFGSMSFHLPDQNIFYSVATTHKGFVVGYIGQEFEHPEDPMLGIRELLSFDWEGNPSHRIILPQQLTCFDIDWSTNTLYGITKEDLPSIVTISLPYLF